MKKYYFTFGQIHTHRYNGQTLDCDTVVLIEETDTTLARKKMFELFGNKWAFQYNEKPDMSFYPGGVVKII